MSERRAVGGDTREEAGVTIRVQPEEQNQQEREIHMLDFACCRFNVALYQ